MIITKEYAIKMFVDYYEIIGRVHYLIPKKDMFIELENGLNEIDFDQDIDVECLSLVYFKTFKLLNCPKCEEQDIEYITEFIHIFIFLDSDLQDKEYFKLEIKEKIKKYKTMKGE